VSRIIVAAWHAERIKPYVRMTQKSKYVDRAAMTYMASQAHMGHVFKQFHTERIDKGKPIRLAIEFNFTNHRCDLSNLLKAVEDAANKILWDDDRWIDELTVRRRERLPGESKDLVSLYAETIEPDDYGWQTMTQRVIGKVCQVSAQAAKGITEIHIV